MISKFIVFEGSDFSGKTTQVELLKQYLSNKHEDKIIFTREPGGQPVCEKIRSILLDPDNEISPTTEAYLYAASRAQYVDYVKRMIAEGCTVVSDRFFHSSLVYQGAVRELGISNIYNLNKMAIKGLEPDLVFYIHLDFDTYKQRRLQQQTLDRLERENIEFFKKVLNGYDALFNNPETYIQFDKKKVIILDGSKSIEDIHNEVIKYIK
jgi:dTMP kinase